MTPDPCTHCLADCDKCAQADDCEQTSPSAKCFECNRTPQECAESNAAWDADGRVDK